MNTHMLTFSAIFLLMIAGLNPMKTSKDNLPTDSMDGSVRTIVINANDQMRFDTNEIRVKAGEKVKLTLNHTGKLAKNVMGHNFVLLTLGTDIQKFSQAAMNAKASDYIPSSGVITHTKLIGGGESSTIEFTAPKKGTYNFICSFPGHYTMMKGKFIVE